MRRPVSFRASAFIGVLAFAAGLLASCAGGGEGSSQADKGNRNLARMSSINRKLYSDYAFANDVEHEPDDFRVTMLTREHAIEARALVQEYVAKGEETLKISERSDVSYAGQGSLRELVSRARKNLVALETHLRDLESGHDTSATARDRVDATGARAESMPAPALSGDMSMRPRPRSDR